MQKIYMSELEPGNIAMLKHTDDNDRNSYHPFLVLYVSQKRILALQFSSLDVHGNSYFGDLSHLENIKVNIYQNDIIQSDKIVLRNTNLEYVSVADPTFLYSFWIKENSKADWIDTLDEDRFIDIINQIPETGWGKSIQDLVDNLWN